MTAIRNAWAKVRDGLLKALRAPRAGLGKAGGGIRRATTRTRASVADTREAIWDRVEHVTEAPRARVSSLRARASEHPTLAIAIVGGVLIGIAWIAWAIYVTASNGANAGLGVLITWPVLIGVLSLVAAPFVLTAMLVQRHRDASEPAMAGAPSIAEEPAEKAEKKESKKDEKKAEAEAEDDSDDEESEEEHEDEAA